MRIVVTALCCVLLAGCAATVGELEAKGPMESFHSSKSADELADCVYLKWRDQKFNGESYGANKVTAGGVTSVTVEDGRGASLLAQIRPGAGDTTLDFYKQDYVAERRASVRVEAVRQCL